MAEDPPYVVRVIGDVRVDAPTADGHRHLSPSPRTLLATLVAAGPEGIDAGALSEALGGERSSNPAWLRVAISRLRRGLPEGAIPGSQSSHYTLRLAPEEVDAWHLLDLAGRTRAVAALEPVVEHLLSANELFAGVERNPLLEEMQGDLRAAQLRLLRRLDAERPDLVTERLLPSLRAHREDDPFNETLLRMAVTRTAQAGDRLGAIAMISEARREFADARLVLGAEIVALERQLHEGEVPEVDPTPGPAEALAPAWFVDRAAELHLGSTLAVDQAMEGLDVAAPRSTVLIGPSGAGKTRTLAEVFARARRRGWAVAYLAPSIAAQPTLGAFLAAFPRLHELASEIFDVEGDVEMRRARLLAATREVLFGLRPGRPLAILVDDAHRLDSLSIDLLTNLVGARTPVPLAVIAAGRGDEVAGAAWRPLRLEVTRHGGGAADIPTFDELAMKRLAEARLGPVPRGGRRRSTAELVAQSGGLPGVAVVLLSALDGLTEARQAPSGLRDAAASALTDLALDRDAFLVGGAAAVLRREFELAELAAMVELDPGRLVAAIDVLIRSDLLEERGSGRLRVAHALIEVALLASATPEMAMTWHAAAGRKADDVHEVAHHLARAVPLVPVETAVEAGLRSAHRFLGDGRYPEAARAFAAAESLSSTGLGPGEGVAHSRALDLAGRHDEAAGVRTSWVRRSLGSGDHGTALDTATSGLPEAEPIDGSRTVADLLGQIDPSQLEREQRWRHARHSSRQLAILGERLDAGRWAEEAKNLAIGTSETLASALAGRFASAATSDPIARLGALDASSVDLSMSVELRAEFWLIRAIDHYEAGQSDQAIEAFDRLRSLPGLSAVRSWHAMLFEAMLRAEDGRTADADALRTQALEFGIDAGLGEASNAYLVGFFVDCMVDGSLPALMGELRAGTFDPNLNLLARAAAALVLDAAGHEQEATGHAEVVAAAVTARPISQSMAALALAAAPLARSADISLRERSLEMLCMRGNSLLLVGAGAACLGPVRRYAAHLARGQTEGDAFIDDAFDAAARAGSRRWMDVLVAGDPAGAAAHGRGQRVAAAGRRPASARGSAAH